MASVTDSGSEKMAEEERNANAEKLKEKANTYFKGNNKLTHIVLTHLLFGQFICTPWRYVKGLCNIPRGRRF